MKRIIKKTLKNENQNDVFFFLEGETAATMEIQYENKTYEILVIADGEKVLYNNKDEKINDDLKCIYKSDKKLNEALADEKLIIVNSNWFYLLIKHNGKTYKSEDYIYSLKELEEFSDLDIIELIEETIK